MWSHAPAQFLKLHSSRFLVICAARACHLLQDNMQMYSYPQRVGFPLTCSPPSRTAQQLEAHSVVLRATQRSCTFTQLPEGAPSALPCYDLAKIHTVKGVIFLIGDITNRPLTKWNWVFSIFTTVLLELGSIPISTLPFQKKRGKWRECLII